MSSLFQQIFELLTTATGTLAYHLVLAFTILGAFQVAFFRLGLKNSESAHLRRLLFGFGSLLALQFILFLFSGLAWQEILDGGYWLPPVDRAVILLSLVCILWMWIFPATNRIGDILTFVLVVLIVVGVVIGFSWWNNQYPNLAYNSSWTDFLAHILALALLSGGGILLVLRRPSSWLVGMVMLGLFAAGHLLHLLLPLSGEQYSGAVRATQLAAFPFLFILAQRWQAKPTLTGSPQEIKTDQLSIQPVLPNVEGKSSNTLFSILNVSDYPEVCTLAVKEIANFSGAEVCLFLTSSDQEQYLSLISGYNRKTGQPIASFSLDSLQLPQIAMAFQDGKACILYPNGQHADIQTLARLCQFKSENNALFFIPAKDTERPISAAFVLASLESKSDWSEPEQQALERVIDPILQHIFRTQHISWLKEQLLQARQSSKSSASQLLKSDQETSMSSELRLALEEIALLRSSLAVMETKAAQPGISAQRDGLAEIKRVDQLIQITQDMQQPLSSLKDYADILLSEQFGVLGEKQTKNLERIRLSTERINRLVNELTQVISVEKQLSKLSIQEIDLVNLIEQAKQRFSERSKAKGVTLSIEQPQRYLTVYSDKPVLSSVFDQILEYNLSLIPSQGQLCLSAQLEHKEGSPDYALIQWISGVDASQFLDISQIFSQPTAAIRPDEGQQTAAVNLSNVRSLVEALGGRIWVDVEQGKSTIFSMILPVIQPTLENKSEDLGSDV